MLSGHLAERTPTDTAGERSATGDWMMLMRAIADEAAAASARTVTPSVIIGWSLFNLTLQDWVYIWTIVLILVQIGYVLWKWRQDRKKAAP